ncbi:MAG TPA: PP2C family protein-serine/threonine phosphatase, partial [Euzebyales bacterium]|nr:PP2C family protein-serine/threonine phosphatase [Euzebyales bacterium]
MSVLSAGRRVGRWRRSARRDVSEPTDAPTVTEPAAPVIDVDIADDDPFLEYMARVGSATDLSQVELDTPAVRALREAGVALVVPLITQGELLGLLNLGPRLSEQVYSSEDRKLLDDLAGSAEPAVRIAQLVRQQEAEVLQRSRIEQELRVATLIQQQFLPRTLPQLDGWQLEAFYRPAREVGGDFYDFIELPDDQIGIVVGDVTDKGVPAALIMAKTHSILRGDAPRLVSPGEVLARANQLLAAEMPDKMFVTCLFAVLDPGTGVVRFANAGHPVPYVRGTDGEVRELRARGMPLGLLPDMVYEEAETVLAPGERVLLHSDGVAEAHDADRRMFGFDRLAGIAADDTDPRGVI